MYVPVKELIKFHLHVQRRSVRRKEWFLQVKISLKLRLIRDMLSVHVGGYLIKRHSFLTKFQVMDAVVGASTPAEMTLTKVTMSIATVMLQ